MNIKKPMATYKNSLAKDFIEGVIITIVAFVICTSFVVGLSYLPEYFDIRDGHHEGRNVYGIRG